MSRRPGYYALRVTAVTTLYALGPARRRIPGRRLLRLLGRSQASPLRQPRVRQVRTT